MPIPNATTVVKAIATFRDRMRMRWTPVWLTRKNAERFMYASAVQADVFADALVAAVASRFPNAYSDETLPIIGRERRIVRGPLESAVTYASRLRRWLDDHRRRGGPYALLAQLHAYYAPDTFPIELVYHSGRRFVQALDGAVTRGIATTVYDADFARWARWWLVYTTDRFELDTLSASEFRDLVHVPREWNAAHCIGELIVKTPDARLWDWPDRTWDDDYEWDSPGSARVLNVG